MNRADVPTIVELALLAQFLVIVLAGVIVLAASPMEMVLYGAAIWATALVVRPDLAGRVLARFDQDQASSDDVSDDAA